MDKYIELYSLLLAVAESHKIGVTRYELAGDDKAMLSAIVRTFDDSLSLVRKEIAKRDANERIDRLKKRYHTYITKPFTYEFSDDDIKVIQANINALRGLIGDSEQIETNHKARLLKRLEQLQQELHKKISDLDRFWGMIGDASVVLKIVGENATPIIQHVKTIMEVVWKAQTKANHLPEGTKLPLLSDKVE